MPKYITAAVAASRLDVTREAIRAMIARGSLRRVYPPGTDRGARTCYVLEADVERERVAREGKPKRGPKPKGVE